MHIAPDTRPFTRPLFEELAVPAQTGRLNLFWFGQAGFALRTPDQLILIDPYLSNALAEKYRDAEFKHIRMMPPPITPDELRGVDYLFASHAHSDHLDPGGVGKIMALNPGCQLVCSRAIKDTALARGADPDRLVLMSSLERKDFGAFKVTMLPSAHEELKDDGKGNSLFAGFIWDFGRLRIYHSGDCVPFDGLANLLAERGVEVALLPVNGRDPYRTEKGVAGNFLIEEAAELCLAAGVKVLVAHHFGMFDFNTVAPEEIEARLKPYGGENLTWVIPRVDMALTL